MLKGHVAIELTNVNTGKKKTYEADNMVTNAIDIFVKACQAMSGNGNGQIGNLTPMATKLLGGLYVFSDNLTEDVDNINFPVDKKLLAFCSNDSDNENVNRGSYNPNESGATSTGYVHVWDFSSAQANGTVKALSLTHESAGKCLLQPVIVSSSYMNNGTIGYFENDGAYASILYKDKYIYYLKAGDSRQQIKICKRYEPKFSFNLNDDALAYGDEIVVATYTGVGDSDYWYSSCILFACTDGKNYAYFPVWYNETCRVVKINLSDFSISETAYTLPWALGISGSCRVSIDGHLYAYNSTNRNLYIVNLSDTADFRTVTVPNTVQYNDSWFLSSCGVMCMPRYSGGTDGYLIYPDGTVIYEKMIGNLNPLYSRLVAPDLLLLRYERNYTDGYNYAVQTQYLATIFNLPSTVVKTASDTMKIIYTLTDA